MENLEKKCTYSKQVFVKLGRETKKYQLCTKISYQSNVFSTEQMIEIIKRKTDRYCIWMSFYYTEDPETKKIHPTCTK